MSQIAIMYVTDKKQEMKTLLTTERHWSCQEPEICKKHKKPLVEVEIDDEFSFFCPYCLLEKYEQALKGEKIK